MSSFWLDQINALSFPDILKLPSYRIILCLALLKVPSAFCTFVTFSTLCHCDIEVSFIKTC